MIRRHVFVAVVLLAFGAAKLPVEKRLTAEHRAAFFHGAKLNLGLRQEIGQLGFLAALSGFRALVADLLWIQAHVAWENTQWGRMALLFNNATALQPRNTMFWDMAAWHMAWNASVAAMQDPRQPREALRRKAQREYFEMGRDFLERGIANNPDKPALYERLGWLLADKFQDHCGAAAAYRKAAAFPDAMGYVKRFAVYELAKCPGHEREAYEGLLALYKQGQSQWLPTLLRQLQGMEEKLNVPAEQRVYIPPENSAAPRASPSP